MSNDIKLNSDDDDNSISTSSDVYKAFKTQTSTTYDVYLSQDIEHDLTKYFDLLRFLEQEVKEEDTVNIKMANFGGSVHTGMAIGHAIKNSKATTIVHVISASYSMGAILSLAGDGLIIYPGSYLMFHNYSGAEIGKGGEIESSHAATKKSMKDYLGYFCTPFLTLDEVKSIMSDRDLYIHHDSRGLKNRIKRHFTRMVL